MASAEEYLEEVRNQWAIIGVLGLAPMVVFCRFAG